MSHPRDLSTRAVLLGYALAYAKLGFRVFPLWPLKKEPRIKGNWRTEATANADTIRSWWGMWPDANIGLVSGEAFLVLDIDNKNGKDGAASLAALIEKHGGEWPIHPTTVKTPHGNHIYFSNVKGVGVSAGQLGPGIDVRGEGGYVVAPPSATLDGDYQWNEQGEASLPPQWLIDLIAVKRKMIDASASPAQEQGLPKVEVNEQLLIDLKTALSIIPADRRDEWIANGHALKPLGEAGRILWLEWSAKSSKFDPGDAARVWDSFKGERTSHERIFARAQKVAACVDPLSYVTPIAVNMKSIDVVAAIERLSTDAGALFEPHIIAELKRLRADDPASFARLRAQTKASKAVSMAEFERLTVLSERYEPEAATEMFADDERWSEQVDGGALLDDIRTLIRRFVIADQATIDAATLWVMFTWFVDVVTVAPIANITAPEKRCGKTVLLSTLAKLVYRPLQTANVSEAAIYRCIEAWAPTLLIDEVDSFLRENNAARGILNAGHTRESAYVVRCEGEDFTPTKFSVWGAKALCGIGKLAGTLADRSIPMPLRRKKPGEHVENIRHVAPTEWQTLRARINRWVQDHRSLVAEARPIRVDGLNDRANDCWEPLLAIADLASPDWAVDARRAALALLGAQEDSPSVLIQLLADIRDVFDRKEVDRLFNNELLCALIEDEEGPWATWNRGKPITSRQITVRLAEFGIKPKTVRKGAAKRGYERTQFEDAFARYLDNVPHDDVAVDPSS